MQEQAALGTFSRTLGLIYEASLNPDDWPYALEALCEELGANKAQLLHIHPQDLTFSFASGFGFDPYAHNIGASRFRRYLLHDPVALYALENTNEVFSDRRVIDPEALHRSPMQTDIRNPADMEYLLTVYLTEEDMDGTVLIFFRGREDTPFSLEDEETLTRYLPHIRRASRIHKAMAGCQQLESLQKAVLNHFGSGIVIVDDDKKILLSNDSANTIIEHCSHLMIRNQRLVCIRKSEQELLQQSLTKALDGTHQGDEHRRIAVKISGHDSGHPILAVTTPLQIQKFEVKQATLPIRKAHYTTRLPNRRFALLTLCDPVRHRDNFAGLFQELFDLTPAEAALANRLAGDCSLKEAAESLGRSVGTARIQLQSIFEKTDTNRQSSLLRLLMSIPS